VPGRRRQSSRRIVCPDLVRAEVVLSVGIVLSVEPTKSPQSQQQGDAIGRCQLDEAGRQDNKTFPKLRWMASLSIPMQEVESCVRGLSRHQSDRRSNFRIRRT
jgi:hypothetical protein